jgi:hypothetical protein
MEQPPAQPALLRFHNPDEPSVPLHYGDSIALVPDGINGIATFAG